MNNIKEFSYKYWLLILIFAIIVVAIPCIFLIPSKYGTIDQSDGQAIVSYCGSILGGLLTLIGVKMTIDSETKKSNKELRNQLKPILDVTIKDYEISSSIIHVLLELQNIGRGEANKIKIISDDIYDEFHRYCHFFKNENHHVLYGDKSIPIGCQFLPKIKLEKMKEDEIFTAFYRIEYENIFDEKQGDFLFKVEVRKADSRSSLKEIIDNIDKPQLKWKPNVTICKEKDFGVETVVTNASINDSK